MVRFALSAAAGALAGLTYEAIAYYNDEYYPVNQLDPKPEAFHIDSAAYHLYARLSRLRAYNPVAYIASQQHTDSLLKLEETLGTYAAKSCDLKRAELYQRMALHYARALLRSVRSGTKTQSSLRRPPTERKHGKSTRKNPPAAATTDTNTNTFATPSLPESELQDLLLLLEDLLNRHMQNITALCL